MKNKLKIRQTNQQTDKWVFIDLVVFAKEVSLHVYLFGTRRIFFFHIFFYNYITEVSPFIGSF